MALLLFVERCRLWFFSLSLSLVGSKLDIYHHSDRIDRSIELGQVLAERSALLDLPFFQFSGRFFCMFL